jgi:hypothetical protein
MDALSETWREHPFEAGKTYVANQSFTGFPDSTFIAGGSYSFLSVGYSRYDSATAFTFRSESNGSLQHWFWYDNEPEQLCFERFRLGT